MWPRAFLLLFVGAVPCAAGARWVTTVQPLAAIVREVAGPDAEVTALVPPNASPHTYEPRPSDVRRAEGANALLMVSPLLDPWAAHLPAQSRIDVLALVPIASQQRFTSEHGAGVDPHFWTDPLTVDAMVPALVEALCARDAAGCDGYRARGATFQASLTRLDQDVAAELAPVRGQAVVLFHPSMRYLLSRYGLVLVGEIEDAPGKEPTPRQLKALVDTIRRTGTRAVFTEPQLPARPAEVLAEAAGVKLATLDPNGGVPGRERYADLIRFNARALREALQ